LGEWDERIGLQKDVHPMPSLATICIVFFLEREEEKEKKKEEKTKSCSI
jgi:hypothetical protein